MVDADSGTIGGRDSQEFILLAEAGEDTILICDECGYAANAEKANFVKSPIDAGAEQSIEEVHTPGVRTIEDLAQFLEISTAETLKAVF